MKKWTRILVIGGGPAGSTVATLLAREGVDVTLLEREVFPRYHIGESLLPSVMEIAELLGVREKLDEYGFVRKYGGYFSWGRDSWVLDFESLKYPYGFQVLRSEFDQVLLEHAKSQGVDVHEGTEVRELIFDGSRPTSAVWQRTATGNESGEIAFDYLIDATGRAGLMSNRYLKNRRFHESFQNVAIWGYWRGAGTMEFAPPGSVANGSLDDGWLWGVPLRDGTMSVGLVQHQSKYRERRKARASLEDMYSDAIAACPLIRDLLVSAELVSPLKVEQDYSYMADSLAGPGYLQVGDAASFIDPLLSTGVHLATHGAVVAAASLLSVLRHEVSEEEGFAFYEQAYRRAYLRLMVIISGLYQLYDGKKTYFWKAQQLTQNDYDDSEAVNKAFLYVVSGMEDRKDTAHALRELEIKSLAAGLSEEEAERTLFLYQAYNKVFVFSSMSSERATGGMYVTTEPRLGLAFAEEAAIAG